MSEYDITRFLDNRSRWEQLCKDVPVVGRLLARKIWELQRANTMTIGQGRALKDLTTMRQIVESFPLIGKPLARILWPSHLLSIPLSHHHQVHGKHVKQPVNYHSWCVGVPGVGKSFLNYGGWLQGLGKVGLWQFDSHTDLFTWELLTLELLGWPAEKTIIIDPTHQTCGVQTIDLFEGDREEIAEELTSNLLGIADMRQASGFKQADAFRNSILACIEAGEPFASLGRFLTSRAFHRSVLARVCASRVRDYWDQVSTYRDEKWHEHVESARNKISPLTEKASPKNRRNFVRYALYSIRSVASASMIWEIIAGAVGRFAAIQGRYCSPVAARAQ